MMKLLLVAASALFMASPALACAHESPDSVHRREIYILGLGIQTSKQDAGVIAKAQELRDLTEAPLRSKNMRTPCGTGVPL